MAPVVERVADELRKRLRPFLEFLAVAGVAGDVALLNPVGTHLTPFVVIAAQPYLSDVVELAVLVDLLRIDVAVVVHDGHLLRKIVEDCLSGGSGE